MNVAIFASAFHPGLGGVEELCRQLAHEYQQRGTGVAVITNRWPRSLPARENVEGIHVHRLPFRVAGDCAKSKVTYCVTGGLIRRQMLNLLRRFRANVIHVQCVSSNASYALKAKRAMGLPLVVTLQGELTMDATQLFQRSPWAQRTLRAALDEADMVTACSKQTLEEAEAWYGRSLGERGRVIYNGVSLPGTHSANPYSHHQPYILAIGRHVPQKGFDVLLRAIAELEKVGGVGHDLLLAGDGIEHEGLRRLATELGVAQRVTFLGRVDHRLAMRLFAGCSFFVLPSRHEPFGIVNLEAMASSKAVVATRVGGVPEIVSDDVNGVLVPPNDVAALAGAIHRVAVNPELRNRLGRGGLGLSGSFAWPAIAEQYVAVYEQVIHAGRPCHA